MILSFLGKTKKEKCKDVCFLKLYYKFAKTFLKTKHILI